ncbi:MAG: Ni/Fe hydrogenase subunit alpha [Anaerolineae bacterium]|nr:Ni/Fe hydrogenase subunit alpha [Anaerolineae bacterium]
MGKKITIEPVTRIEGHAKVTIHLDDAGKVDRAFFHVNEFRGFEKFSEGRPFFEMPQITQRICGICPVSHHLASSKACDAVAGVTPPRTARLLRELMHMGQTVQSHCMHFFELAGPDLLLGFDADPAIRNVVGVIQLDASLALKAVALRRYGQEVIRLLGTKRVHPVFGIPGGVNAPLLPESREAMLRPLDEMIANVQAGIAVAKGWYEKNRALVESFAVFPSGYMGTVGPNGELELYEGQVRIVDRDGRRLVQFDARDYRDHIAEHVEDWSYLKFPYYRKLGWPDGTYRVGPLGRLNACDSISTPLAQAELKVFKQLNGGRPVEQTLYFHYARLIEALYALERIRQILEDPEICSTDILAPWSTVTGEGIGCIEAPRGTLFHHYWTDENGQLTRVNLIVATGHNNWAMSRSVEMVAKAFVDGSRLTEGMLNRVEAAIRAHDPCLSCATHAVGQMPLEVIVYGSDGREVRRIERA